MKTKRKSDAPAICLGYWTHNSDGSEFDYDHEYSSEITCDHCRFGPDPKGYDPRFPCDKQPRSKTP